MATRKKSAKRRTRQKAARGEPSGKTGLQWVSIAEAAKLSNRSTAQFYIWKSNGTAPFAIEKRDGKVVVNRSALMKWAEANPKRGRRTAKASVARPSVKKKRASTSSEFTFEYNGVSELENWVQFLGSLLERGVDLSCTIQDGKVTLR